MPELPRVFLFSNMVGRTNEAPTILFVRFDILHDSVLSVFVIFPLTPARSQRLKNLFERLLRLLES